MKVVVLFLLLIFASMKNLRNLDDFDWDKVYNELILKHNILRSKHNATALTKFDEIAELCKTTLQNCIDQGKLVHSGLSYNGQGLGQNLFVQTGSADAGSIMHSWYDMEKNLYNYTKGLPPLHFTQVIWKGSKQIGCAYQVGPWSGFSKSYYVCCNYFPAGNVVNYMKENVQEPIE